MKAAVEISIFLKCLVPVVDDLNAVEVPLSDSSPNSCSAWAGQCCDNHIGCNHAIISASFSMV
jgi:hypothetical protein